MCRMELPQLPDSRLYSALLENSFDGICLVNADGRITFWNNGAERITGRTSEQVLGDNASIEILQHLDESGVQLKDGGCPLIGTIRDGIGREVEVIIRHVEGYPIPVLVRTFPVHRPPGGSG